MRKKNLRIALWVILVITAIVMVVAVLIYIPAVQRFIKDKAVAAVSGSTGLDITVDGFRMRFPAVLRLDEVTVSEPGGDTLLYSRTAGVRVALLPLIRSKVRARGLELGGIYINYSDSSGSFTLRGRV
ncbi:MAG: hypothetical protein LUF87_10735, partial [Alistipes sp.]|nr:hypothetical protein [Alistipes sp.]